MSEARKEESAPACVGANALCPSLPKGSEAVRPPLPTTSHLGTAALGCPATQKYQAAGQEENHKRVTSITAPARPLPLSCSREKEPNMPATLEAIQSFLNVKRIAMVGLSRNQRHFSVTLFDELLRRGYDVIPVNPAATTLHGHPCFARAQDIQPPVEAALLMTPASATDAAVADCVQAGVRRIWMYRAGTRGGSVTDCAVTFCHDHCIEVIPGECPFMFLPHNGFHAVHGFLRKLTGGYPKHQAA